MNIQTLDSAKQPCKQRVLIVENDPMTRADLGVNLSRWSYQAVTAEGVGMAMIDDALRQAQSKRCHIALVDIRLLDDYDPDDLSGLDLARELRRTAPMMIVIILSAHGDRVTAVEALTRIGAADFVGKEEGPLHLRQVIAEQLRKACHCQLDIEWYPGYSPANILSRLRVSSPEAPPDEVRCVICQLFKHEQVSRVLLRPVRAFYHSSPSAALAARSVVMVATSRGANDHWHQPEIIKLAQRDRIVAEIERYRAHVRHYLPSHRTARIEDSDNASLQWDIGAIRYTNVETDRRRPLRQWYGTVDEQQVVACLDDLFNATLGRWYDAGAPQRDESIFEYYVSCFPKLGQRIDQYRETRTAIELPGLPFPVRDPVIWAGKHRQQSRFISRWEALTHGDLHSENVYVDQHSQTCVLDYERSGPGYVLRDFVELEADIRLRLLTLSEDELPLGAHLDLLLLTQDAPDRLPEWKGVPEADAQSLARVQKAFGAIRRLRQLAAQLTRFEQMQEYYWALLMETLISVVREEPEADDPKVAALLKTRAQISAALLCERLAHWGQPWPPKAWGAGYQ